MTDINELEDFDRKRDGNSPSPKRKYQIREINGEKSIVVDWDKQCFYYGCCDIRMGHQCGGYGMELCRDYISLDESYRRNDLLRFVGFKGRIVKGVD